MTPGSRGPGCGGSVLPGTPGCAPVTLPLGLPQAPGKSPFCFPGPVPGSGKLPGCLASARVSVLDGWSRLGPQPACVSGGGAPGYLETWQLAAPARGERSTARGSCQGIHVKGELWSSTGAAPPGGAGHSGWRTSCLRGPTGRATPARAPTVLRLLSTTPCRLDTPPLWASAPCRPTTPPLSLPRPDTTTPPTPVPGLSG